MSRRYLSTSFLGEHLYFDSVEDFCRVEGDSTSKQLFSIDTVGLTDD